jgi:hypothetical protein
VTITDVMLTGGEGGKSLAPETAAPFLPPVRVLSALFQRDFGEISDSFKDTRGRAGLLCAAT